MSDFPDPHVTTSCWTPNAYFILPSREHVGSPVPRPQRELVGVGVRSRFPCMLTAAGPQL